MKYLIPVMIFFLMVGVHAMDTQSCLPHLVVGGGYETTVTLTNLVSDATLYTYIQFYTEDGALWRVTSQLGTTSRFNFNLNPQETVTLVLTSNDKSMQNGWAMVVGRGPVLVSANYRFMEDSLLLAAAAVLPATPDVFSVIPVMVDLDNEENTGIALVNPSDTAGDATLQLLDAQGQVVAIRTVDVPSRGKFVAFVTNDLLFPGVELLDGFIYIESLQPLSVMALRTDHQLFSSLPAVHHTLPWRNAHTIFVSPLLGHDLAGDGSLAQPYKTIKKAKTVADRGWNIYLLPGVYNEESGEIFPIMLSFCVSIRGAHAESVCIMGNGTWGEKEIHATFVGEHKGLISNVTIMNPEGTGIYTGATITVSDCRILNCADIGMDIIGGNPILVNNLFSLNTIGVHIGPDASVDMGGGIRYSTGGNILLRNDQCDLWLEVSPECGNCSRSLRFNSWDTADPIMGTECVDGVDIVRPAGTIVRY